MKIILTRRIIVKQGFSSRAKISHTGVHSIIMHAAPAADHACINRSHAENGMHSKRRQILDILKMRGSSTVEELRRELGITSVTVRHHLEIMRAEELVREPSARHRSAPGRPHYEYALTTQAEEYFPKSYADLAFHLMKKSNLAMALRNLMASSPVSPTAFCQTCSRWTTYPRLGNIWTML